MNRVGRPMKRKLRNVTIVEVLTPCRLYGNTKEPGLETLIRNSVRSKQRTPRLTDQRHPTNKVAGTSTVVMKERLGRRNKIKHFAKKPKTLEITPRVRVQLGGGNIQNRQNPHSKLIKKKTNVDIGEKGRIHEEEIRLALFPAITNAITSRTLSHRHEIALNLGDYHRDTRDKIF